MNSPMARGIFRARASGATMIATIRTSYYRLLGMQVGRGTLLPRVYVTWPHQVWLGRDCQLEHDIHFKFDGIYLPGPRLIVGGNVFIGAGCEFNFRQRVEIGPNCLIASGCKFIDHDHASGSRETPMREQEGGKEAAIVLDRDVWLGANVLVLKGVAIGRGAIVAAGAVVNQNVPEFEIWGGVPARKIGGRALSVIPSEVEGPSGGTSEQRSSH